MPEEFQEGGCYENKKIIPLILVLSLILSLLPSAAFAENGSGAIYERFVSVSAQGRFYAAVTESGDLYTWGKNDCGQLGLGDRVNRKTPTKVDTISNVVRVSTSDTACAAVTANGMLYTWGFGGAELGLGEDKAFRYQTRPQRVELSDVSSVALGPTFSAAVTKEGKLYVWAPTVGGSWDWEITRVDITLLKYRICPGLPMSV